MFPTTNHGSVNVGRVFSGFIGQARRNVQKAVMEAAKRQGQTKSVPRSLCFPAIENRTGSDAHKSYGQRFEVAIEIVGNGLG